MRFYVPEWDDAVDAHYDFEHDELSTLSRKKRELDYVWDIFDRETTPIDGVLISREKVEETRRKRERLLEHGVYDDPVLSIPDWLPTISDCGAWGYKSLPFPPYGNAEMLDFYEQLDVSVGVTIDHLVLGSGKDKGRLYLDKRAFHNDFQRSDIPDTITESVEVMDDEWKDRWPAYTAEHEPSLWTVVGKAIDLQVDDELRTVTPNTTTKIEIHEDQPVELRIDYERQVQFRIHTGDQVRVDRESAESIDISPGSVTTVTLDPDEVIEFISDTDASVRLEPESDSRITLSPGYEVGIEVGGEETAELEVGTDSPATLALTADTPVQLQSPKSSTTTLDPGVTTEVSLEGDSVVTFHAEDDAEITIGTDSRVDLQTNAEPYVQPLQASDFEGDVDQVLARLTDDPRAVYRQDDKQFRYDLTLRNAKEMYALYEDGDYPFRLMVAVQGWTAESYVNATERVLQLGYDYVGIGGVAGSPIHEVRKIVKEIGKTIGRFERRHETRVDPHVFGFAKSDAFETVGRSGVASFDSASMLRSAWTGDGNYRLSGDDRYDAIRVRYPKTGADLSDAVETALRGRELLEALRAYDARESIPAALREWEATANKILPATVEYLQEHRHDEKFNESTLRDVEDAFREDFEYARKLRAYFSKELRGELVRNLREDSAAEPLPFDHYTDLLGTAAEEFTRFPRMEAILEREAKKENGMDRYQQFWFVLQDYAIWSGDEDLLDAYQKTIEVRPWEQCECPICDAHGVEVCIFRGNDRNRRRGFHNTRKFYDEFDEDLPKTLVAMRGSVSFKDYDSVEAYLKHEAPEFWNAVHDLPVAEVGVFDANGVYEWASDTPESISFAPGEIADTLSQYLSRYQQFYLYDPADGIDEQVIDELSRCETTVFTQPEELRASALQGFGENYAIGTDFLPHSPTLETEDGLDILIIDQCSGSKYTPEGTTVFEEDELNAYTKEELLGQDNARGVEAADLYTGRQQEAISQAVRTLRADGHSVERHFISAGFGLVGESEKIPPYEMTFSGMRMNEVRQRSSRLKIKSDLERLLRESNPDIVFFALGKKYYASIDIDNLVQELKPNQIGVVFNRELADDQFENIVSVPARLDDAKRHGTIVIGLKGLYLENFAKYLSEVEAIDTELINKLCRHIEEEPMQAGIENF